jgi:oxygen-independent coproporphyrinogen-3 oxidase
MQVLAKQLAFELQRFSATNNSIESVFIGGGTPSTVAPKLYEEIFTLIKPYLQDSAEITTEANPNSATKEWLHGMYALGVNRVSFGVQSFDAQKLKLLNRAHTPKQAEEAILHAMSVGFKNISLDLIYATHGDTKVLLDNDITKALALPINHISAYALTIEEGTPFETKPHMSKEHLKTTQWIFDTLKKHGFTQYEISNFGTYQSVHNKGYWEYKDYIGAGSGAVGKLGDRRFYPIKNIEAYIENPFSIEEEFLSQEDQLFEKIFLGFRSSIGVAIALLNEAQNKRALILVEEKKLLQDGTHYYNPDFLLADEIALFLLS